MPIYFVGEQNEQHYVAMERVYGESLGDRIARGPLAWPDALDIVLQAVKGLQHAQIRGLVHRDVKPDSD